MLLLTSWLEITADWRPAFHQSRSFLRALCQALGSLTAFGRRTLSRVIWAQGHHFDDWSADYRLFSRAAWQVRDLFQPILQRARPMCLGRFLCVAVDDTRLRKTGRRILSAFFQRDPLSPKFRFNLMFGLRFLQISLLIPLYRSSLQPARALPVRFQEVPALKRPGRRASPQQWAAFQQQQKLHNLSTHTVDALRDLRTSLDDAGYKDQCLLAVCDNSFCNRTIFTADLPNTAILARARRDTKLCHRVKGPGPRFYDALKFTPKQVYDDQSIPWQEARIFHGGQWRQVRFKQVTDVYWQSGSGRKPLRLLVVARIPYQVPGRERKSYGDPAFLLTTDLAGTPEELLQAYFDRWQIEVNHREEKDTLGVGQAQLRSAKSVSRQPAFVVAAYSALLLAGLLAFGPERTNAFETLPKWRKSAVRPSCLDLITLLRKEMIQNPALLAPLGLNLDWKDLGLAAAA